MKRDIICRLVEFSEDQSPRQIGHVSTQIERLCYTERLMSILDSGYIDKGIPLLL